MRAALGMLLSAAFLFAFAPAQGFAAENPAPAEGGSADPGPSFTLISAEPAPGSWVPDPPDRLYLQFSAAVEPDKSRITVSSYRQGDVPGRVEGRGSNGIVFVPQAPLEEATYEVMWHVTSVAGSPEEGRYHFTYMVPKAEWEEALDRRLINRLLGNLVPGWVLIIPAVAGVGGIVWVFWHLFRP